MVTNAPPQQFVFAVVGPDRLLRTIALESLLSTLNADSDGLSTTRVDGEAAELADVLMEVRTGSLLGDLPVVIVDNADPFVKTHREALEEYCTQPSPTGVLVLNCQSMPATTRLYKIIKKQGDVIRCEVPTKQAMGAWIAQRAWSVYQKRISGPATSMLRERIGDLPGLLDAELAKLRTFVGEREQITPADVSTICGNHREEKVFGVIDAMIAGETGTALALWEQVVATDRAAESPRSVAGLASAMRKWVQARRLIDGGASVGVASKGIWTPNAQAHLTRVSTVYLESMQRGLLDAELKSRSGLSGVRGAIEQWIVTCSSGRTARAAG